MKHLLTVIAILLVFACCTRLYDAWSKKQKPNTTKTQTKIPQKAKADRNRMRTELDSINQCNRNDLPFTAADVQSYIDFFDDYLSFKMLSASPKEG